jgi:hypothetical protein
LPADAACNGAQIAAMEISKTPIRKPPMAATIGNRFMRSTFQRGFTG